MIVSPSSLRSRTSFTLLCSASSETKASAWETTIICDRSEAFAINLAKAGNKEGCRLFSGSLRMISSGGRGDNNAAASSAGTAMCHRKARRLSADAADHAVVIILWLRDPVQGCHLETDFKKSLLSVSRQSIDANDFWRRDARTFCAC